MIKPISRIVLTLTGLAILQPAFTQVTKVGANDLSQNTITTAVPFLLITPDSRAGAMGDAGVATPDDVNAMHWNIGKVPFNEKKGAIGLSYTPWLRNIVPDINMGYLSGYYKNNNNGAIAGSLRYFSLGSINFTDNQGNSMGVYNPSEFAIDFGYAQKLSNNFSIGIGFRFIYSNLAASFNQSQNAIKAGTSYAGDIGAYYRNKFKMDIYKVQYGIGASITNIGSKLTYTSAQYENFIPINFRVGTYMNLELDKYNTLAFLLDFNKLLVPTPPIYLKNTFGKDSIGKDNKPIISSGMSSDVPVVQGMIQSFYDAPGGIKEELKEYNISGGVEYWYEKAFALRAGYMYESPMKGNRQYATFGMGLRYNVFGLDAAYLWSFVQQHNPLENTIRFSLTFDIDAFATQKNNDTPDNNQGGSEVKDQ